MSSGSNIQTLDARLGQGQPPLATVRSSTNDVGSKVLLPSLAFVAGAALASTFWTLRTRKQLDQDPLFTPF